MSPTCSTKYHALKTAAQQTGLQGPVTCQRWLAVLVSVPSERAYPTNASIDTWFKFRMAYLLVAVVTFTLKLLYYPGVATGQFDAGANAETLGFYFQYRAGFVILISYGYIYSYLKDWHFEKVSLAILMVGVTALVLDYFKAYVYLSQTPVQWIAGLIALRFLAIFCLLMNAMNARHAPPMPRRLWS